MAAVRHAAEGGWETWVNVTIDGRKHRQYIRGRTRAEVTEEADKARERLRGGTMPDGGKDTMQQWLGSWIKTRESAGKVRPKTLTGYRTDAKLGRSPTTGPGDRPMGRPDQ